MRWLGLDWDGHEYYQSQFWARHAEVAHQLLERGARLSLLHDARRSWPRSARRRRPSAGRSASTARGATSTDEQGDKPFVIRLKAPREGETVIDDRVQGRVTVQNAELDDFILLRSDGTPTYMLAVVVDDHDMGVTHVIRGDDHLNNAFRQLAIIRAMGWPEPIYAHVPLIHGPDGAKLSQAPRRAGRRRLSRRARHPARGAVDNYLLRLGWGHGDDEIISREQAIEWFDLDHVGKSPSRFDFKKLENLNGHYIREADDDRLAELVAPRLGIGRRQTGAARPGHAGAQGPGAHAERARRRRALPVRQRGRSTSTKRAAALLTAEARAIAARRP